MYSKGSEVTLHVTKDTDDGGGQQSPADDNNKGEAPATANPPLCPRAQPRFFTFSEKHIRRSRRAKAKD